MPERWFKSDFVRLKSGGSQLSRRGQPVGNFKRTAEQRCFYTDACGAIDFVPPQSLSLYTRSDSMQSPASGSARNRSRPFPRSRLTSCPIDEPRLFGTSMQAAACRPSELSKSRLQINPRRAAAAAAAAQARVHVHPHRSSDSGSTRLMRSCSHVFARECETCPVNISAFIASDWHIPT